MIDEIKDFIERFTQAELNAYNAKFIPNLSNYNEKIGRMYSFCHMSLHQRLGISRNEELKEIEFYNDYKDWKFEYPRFLFKISHYKHPKYDDLFLAYVSDAAKNYKKYNRYSDCFFISKFKGEYKIFSFCFNSSFDGFKWKCGMGVEDVSIKTAGKLIEIKRYLEPNPKKDKLLKLNLKEHYRDR